MTAIAYAAPPKVCPCRRYSVSEVAELVRRTRKCVLADVSAGLLTGRWGEVRSRSKSWQRGKSYIHVAQGWVFDGREVQKYVDYRYACIGNKSPVWQRGLKPSAAELVLDHGYSPEGAALELGIKQSSVRRSVQRERRRRGL